MRWDSKFLERGQVVQRGGGVAAAGIGELALCDRPGRSRRARGLHRGLLRGGCRLDRRGRGRLRPRSSLHDAFDGPVHAEEVEVDLRVAEGGQPTLGPGLGEQADPRVLDRASGEGRFLDRADGYPGRLGIGPVETGPYRRLS